jgi:hypothetical protein
LGRCETSPCLFVSLGVMFSLISKGDKSQI